LQEYLATKKTAALFVFLFYPARPLNILSRYILRQFAKNILMLLLSFIAIYVLSDFFE